MDCRFRRSILAVACFAALVVARESSAFLYATEADDRAYLLSERGGGGGRGGGYHSSAGEGYRGDGAHNYDHNRSDFNRGDFNREGVDHQDFNRDNYNRDDWNRNEWNGNQDWNGAGAGWGVDAVVPGEYVYPGAVAPANSGDMDTLYDYESASPSSPGN